MPEQPEPTLQSTPKTSWLRRILFFLKFLEIRLRFIAILAITALAVGYWDHIQNYYERYQREHAVLQSATPETPAASETQSDTEYVCGMHPFVVRDHPGKCPICGMDLTPRKKGAPAELPEGVLNRVQTSPERVMQAGVEVQPVEYRLLVRTIRSYGVIEVDEARVAQITARFPGRIEELMVSTTGARVAKGQPLARIYSPKYLAASDEYLRALSGQRGSGNAIPEEKMRTEQLMEAAKKRLRLAGFTEDQLDVVAKTGTVSNSITLFAPMSGTVMEKNALLGETVDEGTALYKVADLSVLWVQVKVMEADIAAVKKDMPVEVTTVAYPGVIFYGNVNLIYPTLETESRTVNVRVTVPNAEGKLKPGMYVNAVIRSPMGEFAPATGDTAAAPPKPAANVTLPTSKQEDAGLFLAGLANGAEYYQCPMDPMVVSDKQAECPLCHMALDKKQKTATPASGVPLVQSGSTERWVTGYACEMHPDELTDQPGVCRTCNCGMQMKQWRVERILAIPETAVVDTGDRKVVYMETASGVYDAYAVTLGPRIGNYYPVLDGLALGQKIVSRGSFLIDAEARLNPAVAHTAVEKAPAEHHHSQ